MKSNKKKKNSKTKLRNRIILLLGLIIIALILVIIARLAFVWNKVDQADKLSDTEAGINEDIDSESLETMTGYTNIAVFGIDNRASGNYKSGNSDTIMIVSINNETKEIKIVSVYRDTILSVGTDSYKKANAAFSKGGPEAAVAMLNSNLDLDIKEYVCVDWIALVETIDALGGIDLELSAEEVDLTNYNLIEVDNMTGLNTPYLTGSGLLHLDGTQALCYARIRKTVGDDFLRASRQRIVLQAMLEKAKHMGVGELNDIIGDVADDIATTFTLSEIISLAADVADYEIAETTGFPTMIGIDKNFPHSGDSVVPWTLESNVVDLHLFLFGEENYRPSSSVSAISRAIDGMANMDSEEPLDMSRYNDTTGANGTDFRNQ